MKKIIIITFITLVLSFSVMAGDNEKQTAFDVKAGISYLEQINLFLGVAEQSTKTALLANIRYSYTLDASIGIELGAH